MTTVVTEEHKSWCGVDARLLSLHRSVAKGARRHALLGATEGLSWGLEGQRKDLRFGCALIIYRLCHTPWWRQNCKLPTRRSQINGNKTACKRSVIEARNTETTAKVRHGDKMYEQII